MKAKYFYCSLFAQNPKNFIMPQWQFIIDNKVFASYFEIGNNTTNGPGLTSFMLVVDHQQSTSAYDFTAKHYQ